MTRRSILLALFVSACLPLVCARGNAQVDTGLRLHPTFADHMVIQRDRAWVLHGTASPGAEVRVEVHGGGRDGGAGLERLSAFSARAGSAGSWAVEMPAMAADSRSYEFRVSSGSTRAILEDVVFGEVWLASGQSNMEWPLAQSNGAAESIAAADDPLLRFMVVQRGTSQEPLDEPQGFEAWRRCTPESVPSFSAVAYHFASELRRGLGVPVGVIHASWGGSPAESWTPEPTLRGSPTLVGAFDRWMSVGDKQRSRHHQPTALYNAMIHPLRRVSLAGVIWYQGESNAGRWAQYAELFTAMIGSWRARLAGMPEGELPFLFVQLANFKARAAEPTDTDWARLREAQEAALRLPDTGMAVIIDIGAADDIHPRNKTDVGRRLALLAMRDVYAQAGPDGGELVAEGPRPVGIRFESAGGRGAAVIEFDAPAGISTSDGQAVVGFALAGADRKFHWAEAEIRGDRVIVRSREVDEPVAVRYAWADNPACNLVGGGVGGGVGAGALPVGPFRSDDWPKGG